jgi:hypothetical protein
MGSTTVVDRPAIAVFNPMLRMVERYYLSVAPARYGDAQRNATPAR